MNNHSIQYGNQRKSNRRGTGQRPTGTSGTERFQQATRGTCKAETTDAEEEPKKDKKKDKKSKKDDVMDADYEEK